MNCSDANSNIKKQPNLACYSLWLVESRQFVTTRSEVFVWLDGILFPVRDTVISGFYRFLGWNLLHIVLASRVREIKWHTITHDLICMLTDKLHCPLGGAYSILHPITHQDRGLLYFSRSNQGFYGAIYVITEQMPVSRCLLIMNF